ncbi:TolB family protein [Nonomuraea sp. NPDC059007]|uniref:TolB family protein n=1 Tax=Nonomuraea sp. NPDC059007 TaxID=3346692 RepID=UPI0036BEFECE
MKVLAGVVLSAALVVPVTAQAATAAQEKLVYFSYDKSGKVRAYEKGEGWRTLAGTGAMPQMAAAPDGRKAAWITDKGKLVVKAGRTLTTVATKLQGGTPCLTPTWSADSKQVAYVKGETVMAVRADGTGARKLGSTKGVCHLAWSADGRYLAGYTGEADALYLLDTKTGKDDRVKGVKSITHVQSLSPDGSKAVVQVPSDPETPGDGTWPSAFTPVLLDTATGKKRAIPVKGKLTGAFYRPDGSMVVRTAGKIVILDRNGEEVRRLAEPAGAKDAALLQVTGLSGLSG